MIFKHINDCWAVLNDCNNKDEIKKIIDDFPRWSGDWLVEDHEDYVTVINWNDFECDKEDYYF